MYAEDLSTMSAVCKIKSVKHIGSAIGFTLAGWLCYSGLFLRIFIASSSDGLWVSINTINSFILFASQPSCVNLRIMFVVSFAVISVTSIVLTAFVVHAISIGAVVSWYSHYNVCGQQCKGLLDQWFKRAKPDEWEIVRTVTNMGCGGCYALHFGEKWRVEVL